VKVGNLPAILQMASPEENTVTNQRAKSFTVEHVPLAVSLFEKGMAAISERA
jgi:hypothetical protein